MVHWLGLHASTAGDASLISDWGTRIPHIMGHGQDRCKNKKSTLNFYWKD